jgi:hypothetical protein
MGLVVALVLLLCITLDKLGAQPYTGAALPSEARMVRSVQRFLAQSGRLYYADVRLVGKTLSPEGLLQLFFCAGQEHQTFDATRTRRALRPTWSEAHALAVRPVDTPLAVNLNCTIYELLRLDTGAWVLRQDTQFLVIDD